MIEVGGVLMEKLLPWNDGTIIYNPTLNMAVEKINEIVDELNHRAQADLPNEPLTLDELRQMGGEPVWCVDINRTAPGLVCMWEGLADLKKAPHIWLLDNEGIAKMYSIRHMIDCGAKFYRRKPEQEG